VRREEEPKVIETGTKGGKEGWVNPFVKGRIRLNSSSVEKGNITSILEHTKKEFWTMDVPSSWLQVNLGSTRSFIINHYTIQHGGTIGSMACLTVTGGTKADALRNWVLQGSNDGKNWTVLRRHVNDLSLNSAWSTASWAIYNCSTPYSQFRILQNGHNSSSNNFLSISG
jgi:hypothetical protein